MIERISKVALLAAVALFMALVTLNNVIDYGSNFAFVKHVLSMDTTFPENQLRWRALTSPAVHHVFYAGIIAWEATTTLARVDWIHWITSARQAKTCAKRVNDACDMLKAGKKRVCCFDPSGYYSKAFSAPEAAGST